MEDVITLAVAQWRRRYPGADLAGLEFNGRLALTQRALAARSAAVLAAHDIELWEWDVLSALWRAGAAEVAMGTLGEQLFITAGSVTHRIGRLERRELVVRRQDPASRRRVLVRLTPQGEQKAEAVAPSIIEASARASAQLSEAGLDLERLNQDLALLMRHLVPPTSQHLAERTDITTDPPRQRSGQQPTVDSTLHGSRVKGSVSGNVERET
jgi:DNA-binding MarR family transcriptional regulator